MNFFKFTVHDNLPKKYVTSIKIILNGRIIEYVCVRECVRICSIETYIIQYVIVWCGVNPFSLLPVGVTGATFG